MYPKSFNLRGLKIFLKKSLSIIRSAKIPIAVRITALTIKFSIFKKYDAKATMTNESMDTINPNTHLEVGASIIG